MEEEKEEPLIISFSEPLKDTPFGEVLENFQEEILQTYFESEPLPYDNTESLELPFPFENLPEGSSRVIGNEVPYEEVITEVPLPFVQKQASYGLLDGKYLIRY